MDVPVWAAHNYKLMQLTGSTMNKVIANVLWNWNEFAGQFWHFVIERIRHAMSRRKSGHESQHFPKFTHSRKCLPIFRRKVCDCVGDPFPFFLGGAMHVLTSAIGCGLTFNAARNRWISPLHSPPTFFHFSRFPSCGISLFAAENFVVFSVAVCYCSCPPAMIEWVL